MTLIKSIIPLLGGILKQKEMTDAVLSLLALIIERDASYVSVYNKEGIIDYIFTIMTNAHFALNLNIIKILITLTESNEIGFNEIIKMKLIDKINFLIQTDSDSNSIYIEYSIELFYDLLYKLNEYKKNNKNNIPTSNRIDNKCFPKYGFEFISILIVLSLTLISIN